MIMGCKTLTICNANSGHSPAELIDAGDPAEHLRQKKIGFCMSALFALSH